MQQKSLISGLLVLAASLWGLYWWPLRYAEDAGMHAIWAIALLNGIPVPAFALYTFVQRASLRGRWRIACISGALVGLAMLLYGLSLMYTGVVRATMLFYLTPVWGTLIGWLWLGEVIYRRRWVAIAIGFAGLAVLLSGSDDTALIFGQGELFALTSGVAWAFATACLAREPSLPVHGAVTLQFGFSTVFAFVAAGVMGADLPSVDAMAHGIAVISSAALLVVAPSVFFCLWCAQRLPPGRVGLLMMSEVVVAVLSAAWLIPDEVLSLAEWLGASLIVGAALVEVSTATHYDTRDPS
ncbi:MAG: DMT family transporter [Pseudomonadota bacterium]